MDLSSFSSHLPVGGRPAGLLVLGLAVLVVVLAARSGWRHGASRLVLALLGLGAGAVAGLDVAGRVGARWPQTGWDAPLLTVGIVAVLAVVGAAVGASLGSALSRALGAVHLRVLDRAAGAVLRGGLAVLVLSLVLPLLPGDLGGGPAGPGGFGGAGLDRARQVVGGTAAEVERRAGHLVDAVPAG